MRDEHRAGIGAKARGRSPESKPGFRPQAFRCLRSESLSTTFRRSAARYLWRAVIFAEGWWSTIRTLTEANVAKFNPQHLAAETSSAAWRSDSGNCTPPTYFARACIARRRTGRNCRNERNAHRADAAASSADAARRQRRIVKSFAGISGTTARRLSGWRDFSLTTAAACNAPRLFPQREHIKNAAGNESAAVSEKRSDMSPTSSEKSPARLANAQIRAWIDQILFLERFIGERELTTQDKFIAIAIAKFVNCEAGATYVDPLTIAKWLRIKQPAVVASIRNLAKAERLTILYTEERITPILIPRFKPNENGLHSTRGDKAFYAARAKLTWRILADGRMTIAQRIAGVGYLLQSDAVTRTCDTGQRAMAKALDVSRRILRGAVERLEELGYLSIRGITADGRQIIAFNGRVDHLVDHLVDHPVSEKVRQMGVSGHNVGNYRTSYTDEEGKDSLGIEEGQPVPLPDAAVTAHWRRDYQFLIDDGPLGMVERDDVASYVTAGLLLTGSGNFDYAITRRGHTIGRSHDVPSRKAAV